MNPYQHDMGAQGVGPGPGRSGVHGLFRLDGGIDHILVDEAQVGISKLVRCFIMNSFKT